jgi:hypothetical protein
MWFQIPAFAHRAESLLEDLHAWFSSAFRHQLLKSIGAARRIVSLGEPLKNASSAATRFNPPVDINL